MTAPSEVHEGRRYGGLVERTATATGSVSAVAVWFPLLKHRSTFHLLVDVDQHAHQFFRAAPKDDWPYEVVSASSREWISGWCDAANTIGQPGLHASQYRSAPVGFGLLRPVCPHCGDPATRCVESPPSDDDVSLVLSTFEALIHENCRLRKC